ncbi:hypothetical protein EJ03DRAFT_377264 [Teratosphaeria nubilosa]|uniref:Uncharacterized protein n=1 Tax=Teratosphaeria nubilosa TaxID=161662 RepID=A0A6G1L0B1_9PEZI|nr:hypothetical protein EJ03DRAFT_377264 [Teratosphaeria nubilosa]
MCLTKAAQHALDKRSLGSSCRVSTSAPCVPLTLIRLATRILQTPKPQSSKLPSFCKGARNENNTSHPHQHPNKNTHPPTMATLRMTTAVRRSQHSFHTTQRHHHHHHNNNNNNNNNLRQHFSSSPLHQALMPSPLESTESTKTSSDATSSKKKETRDSSASASSASKKNGEEAKSSSDASYGETGGARDGEGGRGE